MRKPVNERRRKILASVEARGEVRVVDLATELDVSVVTARRDVEELARAGKLRRGHGTARRLASPTRSASRTTGEDKPVALVVPERHAYLNEIVHNAQKALEASGMRSMLHIAPRGVSAERPIVERMLKHEVAGLLIAPRWRSRVEEEDDYRWLARAQLPMVLLERRPRPGSALHAVDSVCTDHWYGVRLAVEHLVSLGHRRIVLAARADSPTARALRAAFSEIATADPNIEDWTVVLSAQGSDADGDLGIGPDFTDPGWFADLLRSRGTTAALLHGDVDALMLVQQLADAGVRIPKDCSVVAYDDVVASMGATPLTAVAPQKGDVGREAARLMGERLEARAHGREWLSRRVELLPYLNARTSTQKLIV